MGKTGMGKAVGKLIGMAKKEMGNLKEQAKAAAKKLGTVVKKKA